MRFILSLDAIDKIDCLREQYEKEKGLNIEDKPSMIGVPTFFGGTDVDTRKIQINFLEKLLIVLRPNLLKLEDITTPQQLQATDYAWKFFFTACWYVQSQNSAGSALSRLINTDLGVTTNNFFDEEDKETCYLTANRFINAPNALEDCNAAITEAGKKAFSEQEWNQFSTYLKQSCTKKPVEPQGNYPITRIAQPLFGAAFAYTGATVGLLSGDLLSHTNNVFKLTAVVGSSLLILGPIGPAGVAIFAPVIASKLVTAFCSITLAHVLGVTMGFVGQGVGTVVGFPLDLAYKLLWRFCAVIGGYYYPEPSVPLIDGLRITDCKVLISGVAIDITPINKLTKELAPLLIKDSSEEAPELNHDKKQIFELKEDGAMYLNGRAIILPNSKTQLPSELIYQLKQSFKPYLQSLEDHQSGIEEDSNPMALS